MERTMMNRAGKSAIAGVVVIALVVVVGAVVVWRVVGTGTPQNAPGGGPGAATSAESIEHVGRVMEAARTRIANQEIAQAEKILAAGGEQFPAEQQVFLLWGEMLALQGRIPEALDAYERAIALGPDHAEYRHVAGTIAAQLGRLEDADAHYAMAQKLNPNNPKHPLYRAQIQRKLGDTDGARANLVASTNLDPTIPVAWAGLAGIALDKNRSQVALAHIRKARALDPHTLAWRVVEAKALRRMGKPEEAANLMLAVEKEDLAIEPSAVAEVALSLGLLGKHADAAGLYVLAVEANPGDVVVLFEAATWLDRAGETERALEYAEIAAGMGHEGAKRLIDARAVADGGDG